jgi:hypothetical protein
LWVPIKNWGGRKKTLPKKLLRPGSLLKVVFFRGSAVDFVFFARSSPVGIVWLGEILHGSPDVHGLSETQSGGNLATSHLVAVKLVRGGLRLRFPPAVIIRRKLTG